MLLVEYTVLDKLQVINEGTAANKRLRVRGVFQKCDEQNNNGRVYPRKILESQVKAIQEKIGDRSLVGALDHPANDAIHLSQASHLITKLWVEKGGQVMGEAEILSTPNGKIVEALLQDNVKIGISSRGLGSVSEGTTGKVVNEDFKLITFDLVSDPSTKGAFPSMCESMRENSERARAIVSKHKKDRVLITMLESKIKEALGKVSEEESDAVRDRRATQTVGQKPKPVKPGSKAFGAPTVKDNPTQGRTHSFRGTTVKGNNPRDRQAQLAANPPKPKPIPDSTEIVTNHIVKRLKSVCEAKPIKYPKILKAGEGYGKGLGGGPLAPAEESPVFGTSKKAKLRQKKKAAKKATDTDNKGNTNPPKRKGKFKNDDVKRQEIQGETPLDDDVMTVDGKTHGSADTQQHGDFSKSLFNKRIDLKPKKKTRNKVTTPLNTIVRNAKIDNMFPRESIIKAAKAYLSEDESITDILKRQAAEAKARRKQHSEESAAARREANKSGKKYPGTYKVGK